MSYSEITKKTGVCRGTAHNWVKAYESAGQLENNSPGPKKGIRGKVTRRVIRLVESYMKGKQRRGTRSCVKHLDRKHDIKLHRSTIRRILKVDLGLYPYHRKKHPKLTDKHKEHRIEVATDFIEWGEEFVGDHLCMVTAFSDECRFHCV